MAWQLTTCQQTAADDSIGNGPQRERIVRLLYAGLRQEVKWDGWRLPLDGLHRTGQAVAPDALREMIEQARERTLEAAVAIHQGRIAPDPADPRLCDYCDFGDICRVESAARVAVARRMEE